MARTHGRVPFDWSRIKKLMPLLFLLTGMTAAVLLGLQVERNNRHEREARFAALQSQIADRLLDRMDTYGHGLHGARGAVIAAGGESMNSTSFGDYSRSRDYAKEFPGVRGYGYIQRVPRDAEADFLRASNNSGTSDLAITQLTEHPGERFVIRYIEPLERNREALGLDIASEPNRHASAIRAALEGTAILTHPLTLAQEAGDTRHGFLLLLPIYRQGAPVDTPSQRWRATYGWSFAPLSVDEILGDLDTPGNEYALALWDKHEPGSTAPFHQSADYAGAGASGLVLQQPLGLYGRTWMLGVKARPAFVANLEQSPPWLVAAAMAAITLLASAALHLLLLNSERRRLVAWNQARIASMIESSSDAIVASDTDGVISHWNAAAQRMFGYSAAEAVGQPLRRLLAPVIAGAEEESLARLLAGDSMPGYSTRRRHRDGHPVDVLASSSPIFDAKGKIIGISEILHDIGDRIRAEERFRLVVEASPNAILMVDRDGVIALANLRAEDLFGHPRAALVGEPISKLLPPELRGHHGGYIQDYFRNPQARPMGAGRDLFCIRSDGARIPVEIGLNPIETSDGVYALASIIEISERKRAEARILELNTTLERQVLERTAQIRTYSALQQAILEHAGHAIIATDTCGTITLFNPAAEAMLGYRAEELIGKQGAGILHDPDELSARTNALTEGQAGFAALAATCTAERSHTGEWTYRCKDGSDLPVLLTLSTLRGNDGRAIGYLVVAFDLSEQRLHDAQLRQAIVAAESANRYKSDFLANMSHEIRTPMNAILGMVYLLEKSELPPASQDLLGKINRSARALLSIINDVLDFSKIEAGRIELEHEPFDLGEVLENLATLMSSAVGTKPVEMVVSPPPPGTAWLCGDALRLGQVLINLVGNAIKFTERGEVVLTVIRLPEAEAGKVRLRFSVRDTGIGIAAEKQEMIFSPFGQVDGSTTRKFGGTGLGLSISRRLVELMGGQLHVESGPEGGSHFFFEVSLEKDNAPHLQRSEERPYRVLVVDDHDLARANLVAIIESFGWNAQSVDSGHAALRAALQRADSAEHFDIILLDWRMPELDGLATADALRAQLDSERQPIIIMVTAFERKLLEQEAHRHQIDATLTKPATASSLFNTIVTALARRNRSAPALQRIARAQRLEGIRLLVVDDSEINREVAQRILQGEGASVELAEDGRAAIEQIAAHAWRFDVVLMDVQMPVMDGYEAAHHLRHTPATADLPIIALTAGAFKRQQDAALAAGMNAFVAKPFEVDELVETILRLAPPRCPSDLPEPSAPADAIVAPWTDDEGIDPQLLDVGKGLVYWRDEGPYRRYLTQFARNYASACDELNARMRAGERDKAIAYLHKMRGAAGSLAMPALAAISAQIEEALQSGDQVSDLLESLRITLDETLADIAEYARETTIPRDDTPGEPPSPRCQLLRQHLQELLAALDSDDPLQIEPVLSLLDKRIDAARLNLLSIRIEEFDFRGAETLVRNWLAETIPDSTAPPAQDS